MAEGEGRTERKHGRGPEGRPDKEGGKRMERNGRPREAPWEMFRRMDTDRDGNITREEFFASPRLQRLPEEKREGIFSRLDRDSDGMISKEEIRGMRQDAERRARDEFRQLDENSSGGLDFAEFSKGEVFGKLPEEKRRQIFGRMDTDGSGEINAADRPEGPPRRKP